MRNHRTVIVACVLLLSAIGAAAHQVSPPARAVIEGARVQGGRETVVPLDLQVVIARFQGEKRLSSVPYVLAVNANSGAAQLNMGAEVPVPTTSFTPVDGKSTPVTSFSYRNVGTSISVSAQSADDGRFEVDLSVDEHSVGMTALDFDRPPGAALRLNDAGQGQWPTFRNFKSRNKVLLRSGQTRQYTAATDRISGETIRIEVTLNVVK